MGDDEGMTSTTERLLEAAEELFATHGIDGASMRDITGAANTSLAAINYHFGNKEGLLRAIILERGQRLTEERIRLLKLVEQASGSQPPRVDAVLRAFIEPVVHMKERHPHFPRLMGRVQMENLMHVVGEVFQHTFYESLMQFARVLHRALPEIPIEEIRWRLFFVIGSLHFLCCNDEMIRVASSNAASFDSIASLTDRLIDYAAAGMQTPLGKEVR